MTNDLDGWKYPIGKFLIPEEIVPETIEKWIAALEQFPDELANLTLPLTEKQLDTPYRPEGWTIRQLLLHIGDSHLNSYVRFKWTLTEDKPVIKAYAQDGWAGLSDCEQTSATEAVDFIAVIHRRWLKLLKGLSNEQWDRVFVHPESGKEIALKENLGLYDWHARHHYAHIRNAIEREGS